MAHRKSRKGRSMTGAIRHRNGVTLPGAWFEGAVEVEPKAPPPRPDPVKAFKALPLGTRLLCRLSDDWQAVNSICTAACTSNNQFSTAWLTKFHDAGWLEAVTERKFGKTFRRYRLTDTGRVQQAKALNLAQEDAA